MLGNSVVADAISVVVSTIAIFLFLVSAYRYLTNTTLTVREVLPGAIVATVALEATFQVLPVFLRLRSTCRPRRRSAGRCCC